MENKSTALEAYIAALEREKLIISQQPEYNSSCFGFTKAINKAIYLAREYFKQPKNKYRASVKLIKQMLEVLENMTQFTNYALKSENPLLVLDAETEEENLDKAIESANQFLKENDHEKQQ